MEISRRMFLGGMAATAGLAMADGCASAATGFGGGEQLRVGILSDIHLREPGTENYFVKALAWYRDQGVDAVIIAGDMADQGQVAQLQLVADSWYKVFPDDKGADGRRVEKVFVYGNHDYEGWKYVKQPKLDAAATAAALAFDFAGNWEKLFREPYQPVYAKTVKGYTFIGMHWAEQEKMKAFVAELAPKLDPGKPFFYVQHAHPKDSCYGTWAWGAWDDHEAAKKALSAWPNAVAFSGHAHYSLTDERNVWQGAYTSIGTSSLSYIATAYGRENGDSGQRNADLRMPHIPVQERQGMYMKVYGDRMVIVRRDFVNDEALGPDWVVPVLGKNSPTPRPFSFEAREPGRVAPEFAAGAAVTVAQGQGKDRKGHGEDQVTVTFPAAKSVGGEAGRVFDYEVRCEIVDDDTVRPYATKRVFAEKYIYSEARAAAQKTVTCVFGRDELPKNERIRFTASPSECFGKTGKAIRSGEMKS